MGRHYVDDASRVLVDGNLVAASQRGVPLDQLPAFEAAGPRQKIYFDPSKIRVGIVTCGGLCPGLNDVIRGIVLHLYRHYGVRRVIGFRNGYRGFIPKYREAVMELTPETVAGIDEQGGTILGTSRGGQEPEEIVDCLQRMDIDVLFVIGGDGSMRGAMRIAQVAAERSEQIAVVGIPKTIDNDIPYIDHSFGFQTAYSRAAQAVQAAHVEASSAPNGVGLVKVMGRHSGFIACYAAMSRGDADFVLIPEVPFSLDGPDGFLPQLRRRVGKRGHAVVVLAEGAGQEYLAGASGEARDAYGNLRLRDFGSMLRKLVIDDFAAAGMDLNLRYIDPSYLIRSVPADPYDSMYCTQLAQAAVHAAMAGRTETVVGRWRGNYVHVPMALVVGGRNQVDPNGELWLSILETTGQPSFSAH
jgi:6-phosphofructokinase 1